MVKETVGKQCVNLSSLEIFEFCRLNIESGNKEFFNQYKKMGELGGVYYRDANTFFALISTIYGPKMYYEDNLYALTPDLHIHVDNCNGLNIFYIDEYRIEIAYRESKYEGIDVWSNREDVDLFYQIEQSYKKTDYYRKFSK